MEKVDINTPQEVVVVFLNNIDDTSIHVTGNDIKHFVGHTKSFDFLKDEREDFYTDADLKVKY